MTQELREKRKRLELAKRKQRQLLLELLEVDCNQRNILESALPNASLIYTVLTEQMGLNNDSSNCQVEAIYQPDPMRGEYVCPKSSAHHTYLKGCTEQLLQESVEETNNNNTQENTTNKQQTAKKQRQTEDTPTANTRQKPKSTISGRNRTTTKNQTKQTTKTNNPSNK